MTRHAHLLLRTGLGMALASGLAAILWRTYQRSPDAPVLPEPAETEAIGSLQASSRALVVLPAEAERGAAEHADLQAVQREDAAPLRVPAWRQVFDFLKEAGEAWVDDYAPSMGAALSYYTVFSVAPLLLIVISVAGLVFGEDAARGAIFQQLSGFLGRDGATALQGLLESASLSNRGVIGTVVGAVLLLVGATTVFGELQNSLDRIWRAPVERQQPGWLTLVQARMLSFGLIVGIGFLLIVSLVASAALTALGEWWSPMFGGWKWVAMTINVIVSFALVTAVFAMIYKILPRVHIAWKDVWMGAVATAALFTGGKSLIGLYIGTSGITSGFGAASSLVVLLVWVYYSAQIFLVGAEFTWVYAHRFGSRRSHAREIDAPAPKPRLTAQPHAVPASAAARRAQDLPAASVAGQ